MKFILCFLSALYVRNCSSNSPSFPSHHGLPWISIAVACHRLAKEQKLYAQENQDQKLKLDKFVANNADEWDIKNGVRVPYNLPSLLLLLSHVPNSTRHRACGSSFELNLER